MPRPVFTFQQFVGQRKIVDLLRRQLEGARARAEPFPSALFQGPSGVGKTLLAQSLAQEYGSTLVTTHGTDSPEDLAGAFGRIQPCDFLFCDEAHNLVPKCQERLYKVIDFGCPTSSESIDVDDSKEQSRGDSTPCTVILATDQPGQLLNALHKRMELSISLSFYPLDEMREIVDRLAADLSLLISPHAAKLIAQVSGGLPRRAKHHLQNLRRHFADAEQYQLSLNHVREFLVKFEIDDKGLGPRERQYLRFLKNEAKASLESLALYLGCDAQFVRYQVEPQLHRARLMIIGSGGRQLTLRGREWLEKQEDNIHEGV